MGLLILCIHSVCPLISLSLSVSFSLAFHFSLSLLCSLRPLLTNSSLQNIGERNRENWGLRWKESFFVFSVTKINGGKKRTWKRKSAGKKETAGKKWHLQDSWQVYSYRLEEKFWKIWQGSSWHLSQATHLRIHLCLCLYLSVCLFVCVKVSVSLLTHLSVFCVARY